MVRSCRPLAFVVFAFAALLMAGCGKSNNEGKIVGKWKLVSAPGFDDQIKMMEAFQSYVYFEFQQDGNLAVGAGSTNPEIAKELNAKMAATPDLPRGKYKLKSGDEVEFTGMSGGKGGGGLFGKGDNSRLKISIDGDNMTMTGSDGTGKLVRLK